MIAVQPPALGSYVAVAAIMVAVATAVAVAVLGASAPYNGVETPEHRRARIAGIIVGWMVLVAGVIVAVAGFYSGFWQQYHQQIRG